MEADIVNQIEGLRPVKGPQVTSYPYILFNKSPEQLRRLGAWGGKANARNQRARRALVPTPLPPVPSRPVPGETATQAITVLDAQFPWLRGAEKRVFRNTRRAGLYPMAAAAR
jgi:hypothetical protein